jgi:hypothetical protein
MQVHRVAAIASQMRCSTEPKLLVHQVAPQ